MHTDSRISDLNIINYINALQPRFPGTLGELRESALTGSPPSVPNETARLLSVLITLAKPLNALEIGCSAGFSASLTAAYMPECGKVTTIERNKSLIETATANFDKMGFSDRITLIVGDAADILPKLAVDHKRYFDYIFIDAAKGQYINFLSLCMPLLKKGGLLVADNVLQRGSVADENVLSVPRRQRTTHRRMRLFLEKLTNTQGLTTSIIPIGDGLSVTVKTVDDVYL